MRFRAMEAANVDASEIYGQSSKFAKLSIKLHFPIECFQEAINNGLMNDRVEDLVKIYEGIAGVFRRMVELLGKLSVLFYPKRFRIGGLLAMVGAGVEEDLVIQAVDILNEGREKVKTGMNYFSLSYEDFSESSSSR
jgi:hypothetical protein